MQISWNRYRFANWLKSAREIQQEVYGTRIGMMSDKEWAEYVRMNFLAAHTELGEAIQHIPWKPWRGGERRPDETDRILATRELVDTLFFVSNILVALGVTDDELNSEYAAKAIVNAKRQT